MEMTEELQRALNRLNDDQRRAVDTLDGPLLIIAGPGTGKTQILSLRAANILIKRDVSPRNILCLTFTDAGSEAMSKRLVELIGRDGYDIEVATFHSFASSLRSRFPGCFKRSQSAKVISDYRKKMILNELLNKLDISNPLWGQQYQDKHVNLDTAMNFIDFFQRSGLTPDEFREVQNQTKASLEYLANQSRLLDFANRRIPSSKIAKEEFVNEFETELEHAFAAAPQDLKERVVSTTGIYVPYLVWLHDLIQSTELIDENGKTEGLQNLRKKLFIGSAAEGKSFKEAKVCDTALALIDLYESYRQILSKHDLYDYQDMITEAIEAISENPALRAELKDQYQYIQVDEFQDTNGSQMRLADLLIEGEAEPNIMVVGDDDQAIMRFQGASVTCIEQFIEKYHPVKVVLKTNYRSTPAVVDLGQEVACQIETRLEESKSEKNIVAFAPESKQTEFTNNQYASKDVEYYALAKDIKQVIDEGFISSSEKPEEAIAVIAPKHSSLKSLLPYLRHFNIPFSYKHTANVLEMESMQYLISVMRCVVAYGKGRRALAESYLPDIVAAPEIGLNSKDVVELALSARQKHDWMQAMAESDNARVTELHDALIAWAGEMGGAPVRELIYEMAQQPLHYYRSTNEENPFASAEFNGGIRALLNFIQSEIENARPFSKAMRLPELVSMLDGLDTFEITIDASIEVGRVDAIRLTTAHSSKGLEFDLVYLIDSDDTTWHKKKQGTTFLTPNILTGTEQDEIDDTRRLLFVAITRAKRFLKMFSAQGSIVRELQGIVNAYEHELSPEDLDTVIETAWRERLDFNSPQLRPLLCAHSPKALSVTALNRFVQYEEGCSNSASFPLERILNLPSAPSITLAFGTQVHAFLQEYLTTKDRPSFSLEELLQRFRQEILWMDFDNIYLEGYAQRFDQIARIFIPYLEKYLYGRILTEYELKTLMDGEVPLYGKADLILIDDEAKAIEVVDFKTGFRYKNDAGNPSYDRQLSFYKLLIESQPEFKGYKVKKCADFFVEPDKDAGGSIHDPAIADVSDLDQGHLKDLIHAVWKRILTGDYDTSAFETSKEYQEALSKNVTAKGKPRKHKDSKLFQSAYEQWLIAH